LQDRPFQEQPKAGLSGAGFLLIPRQYQIGGAQDHFFLAAEFGPAGVNPPNEFSIAEVKDDGPPRQGKRK
jgi:hypothetical protein